MTEEEYGLCKDISILEGGVRGTRTFTDRRWRLFNHACAQRVRHLFTRPAILQAIDTALRFAEGVATKEELQESRLAVRDAASKSPRQSKWDVALRAVLAAPKPL